jgi:hypothetical protein
MGAVRGGEPVTALPGHDLAVLAGWAIAALLTSLRLFQWEPRAPR